MYYLSLYALTARINRAVKNVDVAVKNAGRQKRDITTNTMIDDLKKKAARLMTKLKDNKGKWGENFRGFNSRKPVGSNCASLDSIYKMCTIFERRLGRTGGIGMY